MSTQLLIGSALASLAETEIGELNLVKNIAKPGRFETKTVMAVGKVVRERSLVTKPCLVTSNITGTMRRKLIFPIGSMATSSNGAVKFFLAVNPVAPPEATMYRASISTLLSGGKTPAWRSSQITKGDLVPVTFKVQGQKLEGLFAEFTATRKDDPDAAPIVKTGNAFHLTAPVVDSKTRIETMAGSFAIEPADTLSFPNQEVELSYRLRLLDGIGRVYTVECGSFTVKNC
ncbi:MAG: hypothetical protein KME29_04675 [Calothrix sp. FI2-JRJ7]|jgi:hypothetical protein|nr:hypothetical protein [Calothrix sp. FI2-JRJ7]